MNKSNIEKKEKQYNVPPRFVFIIMLLFIYILYVYIIGWKHILIYFTYFIIFLVFFNIKIKTDAFSNFYNSKCEYIMDEINRLTKMYNICKNRELNNTNVCKNNKFNYTSLLETENGAFINNNNNNNIYNYGNKIYPFPYSVSQ